MTTTAHQPVSGASGAGIVSSFLAELTRAMQAAAELERERIASVVANVAVEHAEKTRARAATETKELRRLADEDVDRIEAWSAEETERIRREADRLKDQRRKDLEAYLAQHDTIIATEIEGLGAAVGDYRSTLDQFFDELRAATDPAEFARRAGSLPEPPDLDAVRGAARASAVAIFANAPEGVADEPADEELGRAVEADPGSSTDASVEHEWADDGSGVGVMDPEADGRSDDLPQAPEADAEAATDPASIPPADPLSAPVGVGAEAAVTESANRSSAAVRLLRSIAPWTLIEHDEQGRGTESR